MKRDKVNVKKAIDEAIKLQQITERFKKYEEEYKQERKRLTLSLKNYMYANCESNSFKFSIGNGKSMIANKVTPQRIVWDLEKLEEKLSKDKCKELIEKQYKINDMEGLIKYLKSCGVNPKVFRSFIDVEKNVNNNKLKQMDELGEISMEDVKGCYKVSESETYFKFSFEEEEE